jgi:immunity protein, SdpI family
MKLRALVVTTVALVAVSLVAVAMLYGRLPDAIPTHFALDGHPDGFRSKPFGAFITPIAIAVTGLVFSVLPRISPRGFRLDPFLRAYEIMVIAVLVMEFAGGMMALWLAMGHQFEMGRALSVGFGLVLIVSGNFMGKVTRNFFVGIRTPWTLASPEVWLRTHRIGGVLFVAGGAFILLTTFVATGGAPMLNLGVLLAIALFLVIYSYVLYRRIENGSSAEEEP